MAHSNRIVIILSAAFCLLISTAIAQDSGVQRPHILGLAHASFFVTDLEKARVFYRDLLGFEEPFSLKRDDGSVRVAFIKVNDRQYIELSTDAVRSDGQLNNFAIYTENARQMRDYLAAHQVNVPDHVSKGQTGNYNFTFTDPDGHTVEVVQYEPNSQTGRSDGKFVPEQRISRRILHVGFLVRDLDASTKFYGDLLGFREFWRGSSNGTQLSWVNMRVPDGDDYVEFMLYTGTPSAQERGVRNHISLEVPDAEKAISELEQRPARKSYPREMKVQTGKNHKRQANLFDPDGTRVELMESNTIDGKPAPSSTAPPPR